MLKSGRGPVGGVVQAAESVDRGVSKASRRESNNEGFQQLQGIKKGILELADAIAINKADGEGALRARVALSEIKAALHYLPRKRADWATRALAISGKTAEGLDELWGIVQEHRTALENSGGLGALRKTQQHEWMWSATVINWHRGSSLATANARFTVRTVVSL